MTSQKYDRCVLCTLNKLLTLDFIVELTVMSHNNANNIRTMNVSAMNTTTTNASTTNTTPAWRWTPSTTLWTAHPPNVHHTHIHQQNVKLANVVLKHKEMWRLGSWSKLSTCSVSKAPLSQICATYWFRNCSVTTPGWVRLQQGQFRCLPSTLQVPIYTIDIRMLCPWIKDLPCWE